MRLPNRLPRLLCLLAACLLSPLAMAEKQTVCTITINSADEQKTFQRFLSPDKYKFVELVERGRKDWLASACKAKVSCDVLIVSGHHGEGNVFFSDSLDLNEHLDVSELERVSCSDGCPGLFANLKEVYLFGCNTLNAEAQHTTSEEIIRSLVREGRPQAEASRLAQALRAERGESSRDRMRLVFKDVPVIYGFSGVAPLGPVAASSLNRYFQSVGGGEVAKGRASGSLLKSFSQHGMVATRGMTSGDPLSGLRQDVCQFANDRLTDAQRLASVHQILQRPTAESRMLLDRLEHYTATLDQAKRQQPDVAKVMEQIAADTASRDRFLAFARDADQPETRARMLHVARGLGWLTREQSHAEYVKLFDDLLARKTSAASDVELACSLGKKGYVDEALRGVAPPAGAQRDVGHAGILACMGDRDARDRVLKALVSPSDAEVRIAQTYLRHRPIAEASELRTVTSAIAAMSEPEAQARALDVLGRHYLSDHETVDTLKRLFASTRSVMVQNAIAGALIRADPKARPADLLRTLREFRLKSSPGDNMVDALIQRLQLS